MNKGGPVISLTASRAIRLASWLLIACLILWGIRVNLLEGLIYEWPRGFQGDFFAAMYRPEYWDGTGIYWGPVFVIEHWFVGLWPGQLTVYFFALADVPLLLAAFVMTAVAARLQGLRFALAAAAWLCYRWTYYSVAVAAHPEILELVFLSLAWVAVARTRQALAAVSTVLAVLTKLIPAIFVPLILAFRPSRRSLFAGFAVSTLVLTIVGFGQRLGPTELLHELIVPTFHGQHGGDVNVLAVEGLPLPGSLQFLGLPSALARLLGMARDDSASWLLQDGTYVVIFVCWATATWLAVLLERDKRFLPDGVSTTLSFAMFFALMPVAAIATHPHTFVFLLPVWSAVLACLHVDPKPRRKFTLGIVIGACYVLIGFPQAVVPFDRIFHTHLADSAPFVDVIWANLVLVVALFGYAVNLRMRPGRKRTISATKAVVAASES